MAIQHKALVVPKASRSKLTLQADGTLRILVSAPAVGGRANEAVVRLVAKWAKVPEEAVAIVSGHRNRWKTIQVTTESAEPDPEYQAYPIPPFLPGPDPYERK